MPAWTEDHVVDTLLEHGRIARPYLGVGMQPVALPAELRSNLNLTNQSALVMLSVEAESPAVRAGITLGEVLVTLEGAPIAQTDDVQSVLSGRHISQTILPSILTEQQRRYIALP